VARHKKFTVDYFPHSCTHGRTMQIIKTKYGNDGRAFWWTLLEILGNTTGHYYDINETDGKFRPCQECRKKLHDDFFERPQSTLTEAEKVEIYKYLMTSGKSYREVAKKFSVYVGVVANLKKKYQPRKVTV